MTSKEEISTYFQELNIAASDVVLDKCLQICSKYGIGAEDFCDQWYAFTASNLNGSAPTIEHLENLERKEFQKNKDQNFSKQKVSTPKSTYKLEDTVLDPNSVISSYSASATTPKSNRIQKHQTPKNKIRTSLNESFELNSTVTSPSILQSEQYSQRTDSRSVQCFYGTPTARYKREKDYPVAIKNANKENLSANAKYMYEILGKKAKCLNNMSHWLGHAILDKHGLTLSEGTLRNQLGEMTTFGRIVSDSDGKINAQSVLLEGTIETNLGHTVTLNLNKLSKYSLFPGQVVVVQGNNPNSTTFIVEKLFSDTTLPLPKENPIPSDSLQLVVACGPFTLQNNLSYEPLQDLLKYVTEYKPHVLFLMGPFIERNHDGIYDGSLIQTFDSFFESLIENIMNALQGINIQVVIGSSQKDAHHHPVYPTPPYHIREKYDNLTFVSDPCMIDIDGLVIGATSVDVLFDICSFELHQDKNPSGKSGRMARIASHLLNQHSFYPLYPPHKDVHIDHELFEQFGVLEMKPHILILPSNLRHFITNVEDCLVINPERISRGLIAGTFARIEVSPGSSNSICNRVSCQIIRV